METISRLGIIAGGGQFPRLIADEAKKQNMFVAICGFHHNTDESLASSCDTFQLLALGQLSIFVLPEQSINPKPWIFVRIYALQK